MGTYNTLIAHGRGGLGNLGDGDYLIIGEDANGLPAILTSGSAASDGDIVSAIGGDALFADGSIYVSVVAGAGKLFLKANGTWTDQK